MTSADKTALGRRIRTLRTQLGLSQREVAGDKLTAAYISRIEAGTRRPTNAALSYIAAALGVSTNDLEVQARREQLAEMVADAAASWAANPAEEITAHLIDLASQWAASVGRGPRPTAIELHEKALNEARLAVEKAVEVLNEIIAQNPYRVTTS